MEERISRIMESQMKAHIVTQLIIPVTYLPIPWKSQMKLDGFWFQDPGIVIKGGQLTKTMVEGK